MFMSNDILLVLLIWRLILYHKRGIALFICKLLKNKGFRKKKSSKFDTTDVGERMYEMKWIVLSDLHMNFKNCTTETARDKLLDALKEEKKKKKIDFVLITGDCFHQNKGNIQKIKNFILKIAKVCGIKKDKIILCPGNHDINRKDKDRNEAIERYRENGTLPELETCLNGYGNFKELYSLLYGRSYEPFTIKIIDDFRIISIDSCLLSKDDKDYGHLGVNFSELVALKNKITGNKNNIVIMHHGVEWLQPEDGRRFQHWLADNNIKMVFCGHNHAPGMNILTEAISGDNGVPRDGIPQFTCGCALSDSYSKPVFLVGEYMEEKSIKMKLYEYRDNSKWEITSGVLRSFPSGIYQESTRHGLIKNSYDIPKIYGTIFDLGDVIAQELQSSSHLYFFGLRGSTFLKGKSKIANALYEKRNQISCRLLVSDPYSRNIEKRLRNVPEFTLQSKLEQQWKVVYEDIRRLKSDFPDLPSWSIRFHEQPLLFRFIMTEQSVYFGYYAQEASSKTCMYRYTNKSSLYGSLKDFFDSAWESANTSFSSVVPDRCSFVLERFDMKPSLVINLASTCNMNCRYCPDGGENLKKCAELCNITQIKYLLTAYADYYRKKRWTEKKVLRITGGEPLLYPECLMEVLEHAKMEGYEKIVLCTNGTLLKECFDNSQEVWESVKNILLLKISLDSLDKETFKKLTGTDQLDTVIKNIQFAKNEGFKIELNFVATKDNVGEIEDIYDYVHRIGLIGVKVLTINDFGGRVQSENVEDELNLLVKRMREKHYIETGLYVHNNKGIHMKRFIRDGCTLTIVDHMNEENSVTPRRTYSEACRYCEYYPESLDVKIGKNKPCATGIMSLTMRADGLLSFCRMQDNCKTWLIDKTFEEVKEMVKEQLTKFEYCYHYEIGEKR